jgi:serine phosphatase RsbU (regulator of sigma subunit)
VYGTATIRLDHDDVLLLYTDGLIEHRHKTTVEGFAPVLETLNAADPDRPLTDLVGRLRRANAQDDTCILAVRPVPPAEGTR